MGMLMATYQAANTVQHQTEHCSPLFHEEGMLWVFLFLNYFILMILKFEQNCGQCPRKVLFEALSLACSFTAGRKHLWCMTM